LCTNHSGASFLPPQKNEAFSATNLESPNTLEIEAQQRALDLIRSAYNSAYSNSTISHHFFVRMAPLALQEAISQFVWNSNVLCAIRSRFPPHAWVVQDVYHEIYLMQPEMDFVDENKAHYDGILKLPGISTLRSLTYMEGPPATLVAATSMLNYTTDVGSAILLDFNRELHYAVMITKKPTTNLTTTPPRVIIKAAIHVFGPRTHFAVVAFHILAHRLVFFGIKSLRNAFESSESKILMVVDNVIRSLNKIHMMVPLLTLGIPLAFVLTAPFRSPFQLLPYAIHIVLVCLWRFSSTQIHLLRSVAICIAMGRAMALPTGTFLLTPLPVLLLHIAWLGICRYMELNAEMARCILLAPMPEPIQLDAL
jgi:hypothetical protein